MIPTDINRYYRFHSRFYNSTRWTFLFGRNSILKYLPELKKGTQILDLGCGTGKHLEQLVNRYPFSNIFGLDRSKEMLKFVNFSIVDSIQIINENYTSDTFCENEFDLVLCSYSLTMMEDVEKSISAIEKHLKPDGLLLVVDFESTPFNWFSRWMKMNHMSFEPNVFELLKHEFIEEEFKTIKAYFGLYSYSLIVCRKKEMLARY